MKDNKIEIKDKVIFNDSVNNDGFPIKGIIRLYDKDGNLVLQKHNMIVKSGRDFLLALFAKSIDNMVSVPDVNVDETRFQIALAYEANPTETYESLTYTDIESGFGERISPFDVNKDKIEVIMTPPSVIFKVDIDGSEKFNSFNSIMILLVTGDISNTSKKLFSRVLMDPVYLGVDGHYTLNYTIYF